MKGTTQSQLCSCQCLFHTTIILRNYDLDFQIIYLALYDLCCIGAPNKETSNPKANKTFLPASQYETGTKNTKERANSHSQSQKFINVHIPRQNYNVMNDIYNAQRKVCERYIIVNIYQNRNNSCLNINARAPCSLADSLPSVRLLRLSVGLPGLINLQTLFW